MIAFAKRGLIPWKEGKFILLCGFIFSMCGALVVRLIDKRWFEIVIPIALLSVTIYFALISKPDISVRQKKISIFVYSLVVVPFLGFYDGVFGPGIGLFFMISLSLLCGLSLMRAVSFTKLAVAACNTGSLMIFIYNDLIIWPAAFMMASSSFIGAKVGAYYAVHEGNRLIRPLVILTSSAMAIKLLSNPTNPLTLILFSVVEWLRSIKILEFMQRATLS